MATLRCGFGIVETVDHAVERIPQLAIALGGFQRSQFAPIRRTECQPQHRLRRGIWLVYGIADESTRDAVRIALRVLEFRAKQNQEEKPPGMRVPGGFFCSKLCLWRY